MTRIIKATWDNLYHMWKDCKRCDLHENRSRVVLGKGPKKAQIFLIGQAPGKTEDKLGKPFVGLMGKILREMMEAIGMSPDRIYISNSAACYPPADRMPNVTEVKACFPRLRMEIELVKPKWIIYCGMRAATISGLLEEYARFFEQFKTLFMNHPGSIRRDPRRKDDIRKQLSFIKETIIRDGGRVA